MKNKGKALKEVANPAKREATEPTRIIFIGLKNNSSSLNLNRKNRKNLLFLSP